MSLLFCEVGISFAYFARQLQARWLQLLKKLFKTPQKGVSIPLAPDAGLYPLLRYHSADFPPAYLIPCLLETVKQWEGTVLSFIQNHGSLIQCKQSWHPKVPNISRWWNKCLWEYQIYLLSPASDKWGGQNWSCDGRGIFKEASTHLRVQSYYSRVELNKQQQQDVLSGQMGTFSKVQNLSFCLGTVGKAW